MDKVSWKQILTIGCFFLPLILYISICVITEINFNRHCIEIIYQARKEMHQGQSQKAIQRLKQVVLYLEENKLAAHNQVLVKKNNPNPRYSWILTLRDGLVRYQASGVIDEANLISWINKIIDQIPSGLSKYPHNSIYTMGAIFTAMLWYFGTLRCKIKYQLGWDKLLFGFFAGTFLLISVAT